jgi:hypothetical protein
MSDIRREDLLTDLRALKPILEREGVTAMALFGSRARRDNRPGSDIDLIIEVDDARKFSLLDLVGVAHTIEDHFGLPANIFMRRSLDPDFVAVARAEEVRVF